MTKVKITIPKLAYDTIPEIYKLVVDATAWNSEALRYEKEGSLIIDYSGVTRPENQFNGNEAIILKILDNGGTIENYLFAIKQPKASATLEVPEGVPSRTFLRGVVKIFDYWFGEGANVWLNNITNEIMYYNKPNPSDNIILTGAQSEIIRQIDTVNYSFLTIEEVNTLIEDTNWVKL